MRSARTKKFHDLFLSLPQRVQETAKKNYKIWKENPFHPSLEFKEVKARERIWSVTEALNPAIKLHILSDKRLWQQIVAPMDDRATTI